MKVITPLFLLILCSAALLGQTRLANEAKGIVYDKEKAIEFRLHTHGWAINYQIGSIKTYYKTSYYEFGIGELYNHKEVSKSTESTGNPGIGFRSYTFGKQNNAFVLRGGMGFKRYYSEKAAKNGVAVGLLLSGGITAAVMKPYYLEVGGSTPDFPVVRTIKYSAENESLFLNPEKIRGSGGIFTGLTESKFVPGAYGRVGVHLDWGAFDEFLKAMEVGIQVDIFPKKLPIMIPVNSIDQNKPYYLNLYVSLQLGKRN
jgi:hypothetical protein